jgi:molybdate transport system substrate-binding protein
VRRLRLAAAAAAVALLAAACGSGAGASDSTTLTVLAASSLTSASTSISDAFRAQEPGVRLRFSFAGSQELASQVRQGAPADVLVTADQKTMAGLGKDVRDPAVVARNRLTIIVARGNPKGVHGLADLRRPGVVTVLAAPEVPAGRYARTALATAGVAVTARSQEPDVRAVVTRVRLGEADAGIVYVTDAAAAAGAVTAVPIPDRVNVRATYPAAVVASSAHTRQAEAFVRWLASPEGTRVLSRFGFEAP